MLLARRDFEAARHYVLSLGAWAMVVSVALMVLQAVAAPMPAFALNVVNGLVFGAAWGFVIGLVGRALSASVCFGIARALGREAVERLVGERAIRRGDRWFEEWGGRAVLLTRLVPFLSFDLVSYAAGLTAIRFRSFLLATVAGEAPAVALYSWVGGRAPEYLWLLLLVNAAIFAAVVAASLLRRRGGRR